MIAALAIVAFAIGFPVYLRSFCSESYLAEQPVSYAFTIEGENRETHTSDAKNVARGTVATKGAADAQIAAHGRADPQQEPRHQPDGWWLRFWCEVNASDYFIALFTLVLATVTGFLWYSTHLLWQAGEKQIAAAQKSADIAEKALLDSDRPWIFPREVHIQDRNSSATLHIPNNFFFSVCLENAGNSPAFPQECVIKFGNEDSLPATPDYTGATRVSTRSVMVKGDLKFETNPLGPVANQIPPGATIPQKIAYGYITYKDVNGRVHKTGFAYMIAPMGASALAWNQPAYEYYD